LSRYFFKMDPVSKLTSDPTRWPVWLNATALLFVSFLAIAALSLQARPGSDVIAVVFPPWWNTQQAMLATAAANAAIVRTTAVPAILVVRPDDHDGLTRLHHAGAWFAIDPKAIAACFDTTDKDI
jgi:hypothetical protein